MLRVNENQPAATLAISQTSTFNMHRIRLGKDEYVQGIANSSGIFIKNTILCLFLFNNLMFHFGSFLLSHSPCLLQLQIYIIIQYIVFV